MKVGKRHATCICQVTVAGLLFVFGCSKPGGNVQAKPVGRYQLNGEIVHLDPVHQLTVIRHQKIEGWMEAMTMEFPVKNIDEYRRLRVGEHITATVYVQDLDYWIGEIHEVR